MAMHFFEAGADAMIKEIRADLTNCYVITKDNAFLWDPQRVREIIKRLEE